MKSYSFSFSSSYCYLSLFTFPFHVFRLSSLSDMHFPLLRTYLPWLRSRLEYQLPQRTQRGVLYLTAACLAPFGRASCWRNVSLLGLRDSLAFL